MTSGPVVMGFDQPARSHTAPDAKHIRRDSNSTCRASLPALVLRSRRLGARNDDASIRSSMQAGIHTSPGLFASVVARSHGEETTSQYSLPRRPFLLQFAIDVAAVLVAFTLILATGFGLGFSVFALLFLSF